MCDNSKVRALVSTAVAYFNRGAFIQYDQSRLDPNFRTMSRRDYYAAPEEATENHRVHLDCSGFMVACVYQTFGFLLKADLTHDMIEQGENKVFHYDIRGDETQEERDSILDEFKTILQAGDIVVYEYASNGHAMLYIGEGKFLHCTGNDAASSYCYFTQNDTFNERGGIHLADLSALTEPQPGGVCSRNYLFQGTCFRFCILRPVDSAEHIEEPARIRSADPCFDKLVIQALCLSHPQGKTAAEGDSIDYALKIKNIGNNWIKVDVSFQAPKGTQLVKGINTEIDIPVGFEQCLSWSILLEKEEEEEVESPLIIANGLPIAAPSVLIGGNLSQDEKDALYKKVMGRCGMTQDAMKELKEIYPHYLPAGFEDTGKMIRDLFIPVNLPTGVALRLNQEATLKPYVVPAHYGGTGVMAKEKIRPETRKERIRHITAKHIQIGDFIVCSDNFGGEESYVMSCVHEGVLYGKPNARGLFTLLKETETNLWMEQLLSRFVFIVLRPSLPNYDAPNK